MNFFRLCSSRYAEDLSGKGAELYGGRWNSIGTPVVYTASSRALAMAEVAVHLHIQKIPKDMAMVELYIPEDSITSLPFQELNKDWEKFPYSIQSQNLGDKFFQENRFLGLKVPSAVATGDFNFLINPRHVEIQKIKVVNISPFRFDSRIFSK
ncbi:RES domain-containing protein [Aquiflexum balticum DSM 16537]|uniref:RES domain-containing protein n=1 Tax=Aquiflexum balticum DSM 16537 TaxID=758820 RepID=A0A1W2H602_9BACT|nr:RES family NAD+ phosphorylase [Aquiflexum balticum]SMD44289.1 RES domain-containing protein [Aquiflexum balticum DSM 16537]